MKKIIIISMLGLLFGVFACSEEPLEKEQYKKEIYLIGATDEKTTFSLQYDKDTIQEVFVTVTTSGTHNISEKCIVEMEFAPDVVDYYNYRYFFDYNAHKQLSILNEDNYEIESMSVTLDPAEGIYKRVPIKINTNGLHCDSVYVIPFRLISTSAYELAKDSAVILQLKLVNRYIGEYLMSGTLDGGEIYKAKNFKAVDEDKVRMWIHAIDDANEFNTGLHSVILTIDEEDGSVIVSDWDEEQGIYDVSGTGTYDKVNKVFRLNYTYSDDDGEHVSNEVLKFIPENL